MNINRVLNCVKKIQNIKKNNSSGIFVSLNGVSESPDTCNILYDSLYTVGDRHR
jgi:hypothetical protein